MKRLFTYRQPRGLSDLVDVQLAKRLNARSRTHNSARKGKIAIFANDHVGIQINQHGVYDRTSLELMFGFFAPVADEFKNSSAVDAGANIGNHSLFFADKFRCVHAFEPDPRTFELLKFNAAIVDNIIPHRLGLADEKGEKLLFEDLDNMAAASIVHNKAGSEGIRIEVDTLDNVAAGIDDIALLKIDVEGFEAQVIRGGIETIRRNQPLVTLEQWAAEFRDGKTESIELLEGLGYRFCWPRNRHGGRGGVSRRLNMLLDATVRRARQFEMVTDDHIPARKYPMLIGVPDRFQRQLGFV